MPNTSLNHFRNIIKKILTQGIQIVRKVLLLSKYGFENISEKLGLFKLTPPKKSLFLPCHVRLEIRDFSKKQQILSLGKFGEIYRI